MKNILVSLLIISFVCSAGVNCARGAAFPFQVQTGFNFDWWNDNKDDRARQSYVPLKINGRYKDLSVTVLTAYADTHINRSGFGSSSLDHLLDTKLNTSYAIIGKLPVDILLGLDFNFPTGKTNLSQRELALIMDPDLVSITDFGEGFNVNPTVTIAKQWGKWVGGLGFGYLWRGEYDYSSDLNITDFKPGDIINLTGEVRYFFSPVLNARLFGRHAWYGKDTVKDKDFYREGEFTIVGLGLNYNQKKKWDAGLTFRGILRDKSEFQVTPGKLATEQENIHGDEWILDLNARYFLDEKTALRSFLQGRYFTENDYPSNSPLFIGKREKLTLGIGATRALSPNIDAGLDVRGFVKHDDEAHFPEFKSARDFQGFSVTAMLTGRF